MHKATKEAHEENWVKQAAEAMDIEIDSDMEYDLVLVLVPVLAHSLHSALIHLTVSFSEGEDTGRKTRKQAKSKAAKVKALKAELQALLDKPLMMRGVSAKYITTRGRVDLVDQLVSGTSEWRCSFFFLGGFEDGSLTLFGWTIVRSFDDVGDSIFDGS